jgi:hypothetical protein
VRARCGVGLSHESANGVEKVRRGLLAATGASTLVPLLVLAACPSLGQIGAGSDATIEQAPHPAEGGVDGTAKDAAVDASCDASVGSDPHNCGRCGHDCLGGACTDGACDPVLLYTGKSENTPTSIVVDGSTLFVTVVTPVNTTGYVFSCTTTDCEASTTVLASGLADPWFAVQQGSSLYWANYAAEGIAADPGSVMGCPEKGCPDAGPVVYTPEGAGLDAGDAGVFLTSLTEDTTYLYWTAIGGSNGGLFRCVPTECVGTLARLAGEFGYPYAVAVDPSYAYWINIGSNQVLRCALPSCGGLPEIFDDIALAGASLGLSGLALYGGNVYWTSGILGGSVFMCPTTGCGSAPTIVAHGQADPMFIAVDDSGLYWSNNAGGAVMHCPLSGCAEPTVIAKAPSPFWIALDPVSVYFTSSPAFAMPSTTLGKVFRVAK